MWWWLRMGYDRKGEGLLSEHQRETRRMFPHLWGFSKGGSRKEEVLVSGGAARCSTVKMMERGKLQFALVWAYRLVCMTLCFSGADSTATGLCRYYTKMQQYSKSSGPQKGRAPWGTSCKHRWISRLISILVWFSLLKTRYFLPIENSWGGELL